MQNKMQNRSQECSSRTAQEYSVSPDVKQRECSRNGRNAAGMQKQVESGGTALQNEK
jgi:hypothetical protein